ncbi:MAG: hypothetical protein OHK93_005890 [Ramalina farinacea]|uniref:Transmembrane protein n=1 Tax=Ramalina farinacea TaxID=258253 RepID=A0AA43QHI3_9LECA|nr:hypothetical protein [Ramalina farinacea]
MSTAPPYPLNDLEAGTHVPASTTTITTPAHRLPSSESNDNNDTPSDDRVPVPQSRTNTPPPEYKPHDMEEPLPPYMERVRMVMRGEAGAGMAMPQRRKTKIFIFGTFAILIAVVIGVSVAMGVKNNNNDNDNAGATKF